MTFSRTTDPWFHVKGAESQSSVGGGGLGAGSRPRECSLAWARGRAPERQGAQKTCRPKASAASPPRPPPVRTLSAVQRAARHLCTERLNRALSSEAGFTRVSEFLQSQGRAARPRTPTAPCGRGPDLHAGGGKIQRADFEVLMHRVTKPLVPEGVTFLFLRFPRGRPKAARPSVRNGGGLREGLKADTVKPERGRGREGTSPGAPGARRLGRCRTGSVCVPRQAGSRRSAFQPCGQ